MTSPHGSPWPGAKPQSGDFRLAGIPRLTADTMSMRDEGHCCIDGSHRFGAGVSTRRSRQAALTKSTLSVFTGFRFPPEVILLSVPCATGCLTGSGAPR